MRAYLRNASPEAYFVAAAIVSIAIAAFFTWIPLLHFASFIEMAGILVVSDVVIYVLMKIGLMKSPRDRGP